MIDHILIPLDGSELSDRILMDVRRLLLGLSDDRTRGVLVVDASPFPRLGLDLLSPETTLLNDPVLGSKNGDHRLIA